MFEHTKSRRYGSDTNTNDEYDLGSETDQDIFTTLKSIRIKNIHNIIIAQLNINSLRNKIDSLAKAVISNIDILLITETKLDDSFPLIGNKE